MRKIPYSLAVCLRIFLVFMALAAVMPGLSLAQDSGQDDGKKDYFIKPMHQQQWVLVRVGKGEFIPINYGDVLASKGGPSIFNAGNATYRLSRGAVIRIHALENEDSEPGGSPILEVLFGEVLALESKDAVLLLPGQRVILNGRSNLIVDSERYSFVESFSGNQVVSPIGQEDGYEVPPGNYLEMSPEGEVGELTPFDEDYLQQYLDFEPEEGQVAIILREGQEPVVLEPYTEYWNTDRLDLLQEGEESPEGLAIAGGGALQEDSKPVETMQAFDQETIKQKSISFSATVDVEQTAVSIPTITSLSIGGKKAEAGEILSLTFDDLDDMALSIDGKAITSDPAGFWKLLIKVNDDELSSDSVDSFGVSYKISLDTENPPSVYGVVIGISPAETFEGDEYNLVTRDDLVSGKLEITGTAEAQPTQLDLNVEIFAVDKDDISASIGKYSVGLDLTGIDRVEVSVDDGISWEAAQGDSNWVYALRPSDNEQYKVKVRAFDNIGIMSEEQFESWVFKYSYNTAAELLRIVFDNQMRALLDEDSNTFMRNVSADFSSDIEDLRDYNELETAIETRFRTGSINIRYTVNDVQAYMDTDQGTVDFYWTGTSGVSSASYYEVYYYAYEEGEWMLIEVTDPNTFLLLSKDAYYMDISLGDSHLEADGEDSTSVTVMVYDKSGTIVADDVEVNFNATDGSFTNDTALTESGEAETTFIAPTEDGEVTITATSGSASVTATITIDPLGPPLPPPE